MREILFKAKRISDGQWVIGDLSQHKTGKKFIKSGSATHSFEVVPETICQYTGLTDKNGNKIWENDIVRFVCVTPSVKQEMIKQVKYRKHGGISPFWWSYECNRCGSFCDIKEVEVVGNIHDNPELLGG